eukprot:COSAG02_NODE_403_length_23058_cov_12.124134_16_plen_189_part_00
MTQESESYDLVAVGRYDSKNRNMPPPGRHSRVSQLNAAQLPPPLGTLAPRPRLSRPSWWDPPTPGEMVARGVRPRPPTSPPKPPHYPPPHPPPDTLRVPPRQTNATLARVTSHNVTRAGHIFYAIICAHARIRTSSLQPTSTSTCICILVLCAPRRPCVESIECARGSGARRPAARYDQHTQPVRRRP